MSDLILPLIEGAITITGLCGLVYYRLNRKFKKEAVDGFWNFLDRNILEIIIGMVLVPDWALVLQMFK